MNCAFSRSFTPALVVAGSLLLAAAPVVADEDEKLEIVRAKLSVMFEQLEPEKRVPLPKPSIDTGMGLERMTAVMQGTHDNYRIDLLRGLIEVSAEASGTAPDGPHAIAHRVIADHLRASAFMIADGVLPSKE